MSFVDNDDTGNDQQVIDETEEELSDYGRRFVDNAPENERPFAEKYVKQWDSGYKKAVSKYEEDLQQYRQLGAIEDVQAGTRLYQLLVTNPEKVLHYLTDDPNGPQLTPRQAKAQMDKIEDAGPNAGAKAPNDPHTDRIQRLENALIAVARQQEERVAAQQAEQDQQAFVSALAQAKTTHGDFDDKYVAYLLATRQAQSIDDAVQQYHKAIGGKPQPRRAAPNLLGASSAAPSGGKKPDFGAASDKEIKDYLVHALTAGNE